MADAARHPPLAPVELSLLLALAERPSYGYGLVKAIAARSAGAVRLAPGNLYQVLDRLLARGWVRELERAELPTDADARRRYYDLTEEGLDAARAEATRLRAMMPALERLDAVLSPRGGA